MGKLKAILIENHRMKGEIATLGRLWRDARSCMEKQIEILKTENERLRHELDTR